MSLSEWFADEIYRKIAVAEAGAVIETLDAAVASAKADHGWQTRTGAAEQSIQRVLSDGTAGQKVGGIRLDRGARGAFGFVPIDVIGPVKPRRSQKTGRLRKAKHWDMHGFFLEVGFRGRAGDHTIRRAGDREFPQLAERIARRLR